MAAAVKTQTARSKPLARLGDWLHGAKPMTVAEVQQQLAKVDADINAKRERISELDRQMVDDYGLDTSPLEAEHYKLTVGIRAAQSARTRLEAELTAAHERAALAAYQAKVDNLSQLHDELFTSDGELEAAYETFITTRSTNTSLRYRANMLKREIVDSEIQIQQEHPHAASALATIKQAAAALFAHTWLSEWNPETKQFRSEVKL